MALLLQFVFACSLLAVCLAQNPCPISGCFGCLPANLTTRRVTCLNAGLTSIPLLAEDIQRTVEDLTLASNLLNAVRRDELENYTSLATLDISFNNISYIEPGSFVNTTSLEELLAEGNQLRHFPDNQFTTTQLRILDLNQNCIENISAGLFRGMQEFSDIQLNDNSIQSIPEDAFSQLGRLEQLSLAHNPLRCDCELRWVPAFLNGSRSPLFSNFGTCETPANHNGTALATLDIEDLICNCTPPCVNGLCDLVVGECNCGSGFIGADCSEPCAFGLYGSGCLQSCSCQGGSPCDNVDGACQCLPGRTGIMCESECLAGMYGSGCALNCSCVAENEELPCDSVDGACHCSPGFTGAMCESECSVGMFGRGCVHSCMCEEANQASNCSHVNGACNCLLGFTGVFCEIEKSSLSTAAIGGIIAGAVCFLIAVIAVVVLVTVLAGYVSARKKRKVGVTRVTPLIPQGIDNEVESVKSIDAPPPYDFQNSSSKGQEPELPLKEELPP